MILAIDIGNSNIVIGCIDKEKTYFVERISTNREKTDLEYAILFKNTMDIHGITSDMVEGAILSSVVPPLTSTVRGAAKKIIGGSVLVVGPGIKTGLNITIDNPAQLGSDLVVDAVAALHSYPVPLIIFDMGTATTISVIDEKKRYLGGMIYPGVKVSLENLSNHASQLPHISLEAAEHVIGKNTIDCMKSGIVLGNASMVDGMIERIEEELSQKATVVATGGLARCIVPHCKKEIHYDDDLLLKGLWLIYEKNR